MHLSHLFSFAEPLLNFALLFKVTQELHTKNQQSQIVDFVDYFGGVTIAWE
jgi:hypothetical protein